MAVRIRMKRMGRKHRPFYRICIMDSRSPRDGRYVDQVGTYDPAFNPPKVTLKAAQTEEWLKSGAKPSDTVRKLIKQATSAAQTA